MARAQNRRPRLYPHDDERLRPGLVTPRSTYRRFILRLIAQAAHHEMPSREVREIVAARFANRFTPADLSETKNGQLKWVNNMQWTRKRMVMDGLLESTLSAGYGVWRLTREGIRAARAEIG
jgi:hypothetical protein